MLWRGIVSLVMITTVLGCKTTARQTQSEILAWSGNEEKEAARQQFVKTIHDCVPLITAVVPGVKTLKIAGNQQREQVVRILVDKLVQDPSPKAERSAELLRYYYSEKGRIFPPCGGEAAEFVLSEFAMRTNAIKVGFGEENELKITD